MMTVAAIIEQAQSRWMDQHPLQVYNRAFQGSYCKYYCILLFVYLSPRSIYSIYISRTDVSGALADGEEKKVQRTLLFHGHMRRGRGGVRERVRTMWKNVCNPIMCT